MLMLLLSHIFLCHPMDCCPPGSSVDGIFQARILEWFTISYFKGSSSLVSPALAGRLFTTAPPGKSPPPPQKKDWIISVTLIGRRETVRLRQFELVLPFPVA